MDLSKQTGFSVVWDSSKKILVVDGRPMKPTVRLLGELKSVLADREWARKANPKTELYYMFRNVARSADLGKISKAGLRYDITIIPSGVLGSEFVKTEGHYHSIVPNQGVQYPEIYEVLHGEAVELMQKVNGNNVVDARFTIAKEGDWVLIPPGYGHTTINRSRKTLVMANWVSSRAISDYKPMQKTCGGSFFLSAAGWKRNDKYTGTNSIKEKDTTKHSALGLKKGVPMYKMVENIESLSFLNRPALHKKLFGKA